LFLRGGYLDNTLSFNEHGVLIGHSPQGSYTLSAIEIDKVHMSRHKVELEGQRFALHFLGALPYEDPTKAVDRVNITPKKKVVKITIDRELVVKPKLDKSKKKPAPFAAKTIAHPATVQAPSAQATTPTAATAPATSPITEPSSSTASAPAQPAETTAATEAQNASEAQAEIAAAPPAERPADPKSVTTTTSQAHANKILTDALDNVFAQGFDERMMTSMPGFWKLYYDAVAAKSDYRPKDPSVLRQSAVDQKAKLASTFEPASNLYHVVIGADGKPGEIAVARPIGFGLDESAVDSIRKATFQPAIKDGKPVPVLLDLVVQFRIYSKRTAVASEPQTGTQPSGTQTNTPALPGPYSVQH
jgi:outer membrane biosynthesis protein TonB